MHTHLTYNYLFRHIFKAGFPPRNIQREKKVLCVFKPLLFLIDRIRVLGIARIGKSKKRAGKIHGKAEKKRIKKKNSGGKKIGLMYYG